MARPRIPALICSALLFGCGAGADTNAKPSASASASPPKASATTSAAPVASASAAPAPAEPRTTSSVNTRDKKTIRFSVALPPGLKDATPPAFGDTDRAFGPDGKIGEGYVIEVMGPNPAVKDAAQLVTMAEKQKLKILKNETTADGFVVAFETKEGGKPLVLLHASVDKGQLYCRGNAKGAVLADMDKAVETMARSCSSARVEP